jgi:hypothetical protein
MPYKVALTFLDNKRIQLPEVHEEPTPKVGGTITVSIRIGSVRADVTRVSLGTVDGVEAQQR